MTTAVQIAERALKRILVQADDAPLDPSDYADFYDSMNAFMAALEADNINLGYTPVSNPADVITIPEGAIRGLVANMAVEVAPDYNGTVSQSLSYQAAEGLRVMRILGRARIQSSFPSNLPMGQGKEDFIYTDDPFFGVDASALLYLENAVSTDLSVSYGPIRGVWSIAKSSGLLADIQGRLVNNTGKQLSLTYVLSLKGTPSSADTFNVRLKAGGVVSETVTVVAADTSEQEFSIRRQVTLPPRASLTLEASSTGQDMTFTRGQIEVY